jgi:hypothetical protein
LKGPRSEYFEVAKGRNLESPTLTEKSIEQKVEHLIRIEALTSGGRTKRCL